MINSIKASRDKNKDHITKKTKNVLTCNMRVTKEEVDKEFEVLLDRTTNERRTINNSEIQIPELQV